MSFTREEIINIARADAALCGVDVEGLTDEQAVQTMGYYLPYVLIEADSIIEIKPTKHPADADGYQLYIWPCAQVERGNQSDALHTRHTSDDKATEAPKPSEK